MSRVLLDTNVVLRLADPNAAEHAAVLQAATRLLERGDTLCIAPQIIVEFWVVATRPVGANGLGWTVAQARSAVVGLLETLPLLEETPAVFPAWLGAVVDGISGKRAHDARIAAVMRVHGVHRILTLNPGDFAGMEELVTLHPTEVAD